MHDGKGRASARCVDVKANRPPPSPLVRYKFVEQFHRLCLALHYRLRSVQRRSNGMGGVNSIYA